MDQSFKIIIPTYNNEKWIGDCLKSIQKQTYKNLEAIIIDDSSTDKSLKIIKKFCESDNRFQLLNNRTNKGALNNIITGIETACKNNEDVIALLDGDDQLFNDEALEFVNAIYQENIWLTYGQYVDSGGVVGCNDLIECDSSKIRDVSWRTSHLRTFKYHLWKKVEDIDLRDRNNGYYEMAWDLAMLYPMIEMAGNERIRFINKILYIYNTNNPLNDHKKNCNLQLCLAREIKNKQRYEKL